MWAPINLYHSFTNSARILVLDIFSLRYLACPGRRYPSGIAADSTVFSNTGQQWLLLVHYRWESDWPADHYSDNLRCTADRTLLIKRTQSQAKVYSTFQPFIAKRICFAN